jgi:negative regulator of flagellin synthesis FlgM
MHIHGTSHIHGPHGINAPHGVHRSTSSQPTSTTAGADRVDISPAAEAAIKMAETGAIRHDLVNAIRRQIADGTYETPEKLDAALDRMLDEIA